MQVGLTLIYHFQSSQNQDEEFKPARYKVVYFFSDQGFIDNSLLQEMIKSIPDAHHVDMTFLNLDDLKAFALRVAQELQIGEVRLISVQDYNIGIDGARDLESYQSVFSKYGDLVVNESHVKKKGLLGKFFN